MEVPAATIREFERDAEAEGARLQSLTDPDGKAALAARVGEAVREQAGDASVRQDVGGWLRTDDDPRLDGVRDERQHPQGLRAEARIPAAPLAAGIEGLAAESPALLILSTAADDRRSWLAAGQALERVLLRAAAHDLAASYLNQVTEVASIRIGLMELTGGAYPQVVFRVGHPLPRGGTQRRRVADVLV
jgi:hypothetical protein